MRFVGLAIFLASIPLFYELMRGPVTQRRVGWFALGLAPYMLGVAHFEVSIISWAYWPGYVKGMIVSLVDSLALAVVLTERGKARGTPLLWAYMVFLIGSGVATAFAKVPLASAFWTWQVARAVLLFVAVSKIAARPGALQYLLGGLGAAIFYQAWVSLLERAHGVTQATGTMGHQNYLGMCTHFALFLSLAAVLGGDRRWWMWLTVLASMITDVLTGSRGTIGFAGFGVALLVSLSIVRRPTAVKARVAGLIVAALLVAAPIGYMTLQTRFQSGGMTDPDGERLAFMRAANAMWSDHPMGVGANQYVVRANLDGYSERAGVTWAAGSRGANVHNVYLLMGAETGYLGVGSFVVLLLASIYRGIRVAWANPRTANRELALGAAVTLIVVGLHNLYEWVFVMESAQFLFAITLGIIAGLAKQHRAELADRRLRPAQLKRGPAELQPWQVPAAV